MFPASSKGGGTMFAFPDVCKTPAPPAPSPVPIPYPNTGMGMQASSTSTKVQICKKDAITTQSEVPRTQGDEAGVAGGMVSGVNMDKVAFKKGSSKVNIEGNPVVLLMSVTGQNGGNANMPAGQQIAPSQAKVLVAP